MYRGARWVHRHLFGRERVAEIRNEMRFYRDFVTPGSLCFDVGANFGDKTEVFLRLGARVVSFEPQSHCMAEMKARLGANRRLTTIESAVGAEAGKLTLYVDSFSPASSLIANWQGKVMEERLVNVTTLDDAIARYGVPDFCKIDVEGFELPVLKGLSHRIPAVSFEYHLRGDGMSTALKCIESLSRLGPLSLNVTPAERLEYASDQWMDRESFIRFFETHVSELDGYEYGDIFARIGAN
jgi:FkbM family methyltransferase